MAGLLQAALARWDDIQAGGPARQEMRKLSHQLRGSGRTYGFREVTRLCKAMENIILKLEKNNLKADDRVVIAGLLRVIPGQKVDPQAQKIDTPQAAAK